MKYIEIKSIKKIEEVRDAIIDMMPIAPKLFLNRETLAFVLELNETLIHWDKVLEVILNITSDVSISDIIRIDDSRNLMALTKTLEVISHRDNTTWNPENLVK